MMHTNPMGTNDDQIDRILSGEGEILPSAGFTASVMEAVRREAAVPPPIPFPWKRAWPILALAAIAIVMVPIGAGVAILRLAGTPASAASVDWSTVWVQLPAWMRNPTTAWTAGSAVMTLILVKFSMRLASR